MPAVATGQPAYVASTSGPRVCYLVADNDGQPNTRDYLTSIDPTSGNETLIGATGTDFVEAIAYDPFNSELLGTNGGVLGSFNLFSGKFNPIGPVGHGIGSSGDRVFADIDGLAVDPTTGVLYGSVRQTNDNLLIQINPTSGSIVDHAFGITFDYAPIGPLPAGYFVDDLAVSPSGALVAVATNDTTTLLLSIDKFSGDVLWSKVVEQPELEGLAFDLDGTLYGSVGSTRRKVIRIDPQTGGVEDLFALGINDNADYEAIDCIVSPSLPVPDFAPSNNRAPGDVRVVGAYPNPATSRVTLAVNFTKTLSASLEVFDTLARQRLRVGQQSFTAGYHEVPIDVSGLEPGVYNYRWSSRLQRSYGSFVVAGR